MSTLRATAERPTIHPHPDAAALELAQVGLFRAVVAKGRYRTGDWAVYVPDLPGHRVRARTSGGRGPGRRARGGDRLHRGARGTKRVPEIPVHMSGELVPAPDLVPWIEIGNVKRHPDVFTGGEPVVATEKIHGTACLFTPVAGTGEEFVSSKDSGSRRQGLARTWVDAAELHELLGSVGLPAVPRQFDGGYDQAALLAEATGAETWSGGSPHIREGLVVRPARERYSPVLGGRAIATFVSDDYLTRRGGTEYE